MSGRALPSNQYSQYGAGGALIDIQGSIERVLRLSKADACIVIGQQEGATNIRWANNTVTTNGAVDRVSLSVVSIIGRRVASVTRTHFPPEQLEAIVRESEASCERRPEAPDYMPLIEPETTSGDDQADWSARPGGADIHIMDAFVPQLGTMFERARGSNVQTFGFAEHGASTIWLATSTGIRRCHRDSLGKVEITAKTPDFLRSSWVGRVTEDFRDVDAGALLDALRQRLAWSERKIDLPAGQYEVLLSPSCTVDLAIRAYDYMTRREADEGRSPFSKAGGGTRIGERLFGRATIYSDPDEQGIGTAPFHMASIRAAPHRCSTTGCRRIGPSGCTTGFCARS
jgi:predicted Zn-dependent protease